MSKPNNGAYNIYEQELKELSYEPSGFFENIVFKAIRKITTPTELSYSFPVSVSEFLRGDLFCNDVSEVTKRHFTKRDLVSLLLDDFLYQAKMRNNPYDLYHELDIRGEQTLRVFNYEGHNQIYHINNSTEKNKLIQCFIKRKDALRLEVMLSDIDDLGKEKKFSINDVLKILYSDFIQQYKMGNLENALENIIKRLKNVER